MSFQLTERDHRWLTTLLILATIAVTFVVVGFVAGLLTYFGDVIMIFFLAWLLAFILSPLASALLRLVPGLPRAIAVILVYALLIVVLVVIALLVAQQLYNSINSLIPNLPNDQKLKEILAPWQARLDSIGLGQVHLADQSGTILESTQNLARDLVKPGGPLQNLAFASIGIMGNLLFVFFISLYMAVDRDHILRFMFRLVPPAYSEEARLLETSVAHSFGGFLRGQAAMGLIYAGVAAFTSYVLGLPYLPATSAAAGILQAIPFFGPFLSWLPPVLVAIFFDPSKILPALIMMGVGWFLVMNVVQPRLMANAVGLHPIVVIGSVLVGSKLAGATGAIFGIPIAAVISAFFFYYLGQHRSEGPVAARATRVVESREGRPIRMPREPQAGEDEDVEEAAQPPTRARSRTALPWRGAAMKSGLLQQPPKPEQGAPQAHRDQAPGEAAE